MADLATNLPEMTVTELSQAVKRTVEGNFERIRVRGEITRPSFPSSGHVYFRLKDENAVLDAVAWRGMAARLSIRPEEGLEVIASGKLTTYAGRSSYQIVVDSLEVAGEGALLKLLEDRKKKLAAEGLFAEERKRPLPYLPEVIGVVTSPSGAVIRDILHRLAERFPRHVLVWPVAVQGEGAAEQVARAIEGFNALPAGGSLRIPSEKGFLAAPRGEKPLQEVLYLVLSPDPDFWLREADEVLASGLPGPANDSGYERMSDDDAARARELLPQEDDAEPEGVLTERVPLDDLSVIRIELPYADSP